MFVPYPRDRCKIIHLFNFDTSKMQQGRDRSRPCIAVWIVRFRPRLNVFTSNLGTASSQFRPDWPDPRVRLVRKNHFRSNTKANDVPKSEQLGFRAQTLQTFCRATRFRAERLREFLTSSVARTKAR